MAGRSSRIKSPLLCAGGFLRELCSVMTEEKKVLQCGMCSLSCSKKSLNRTAEYVIVYYN